MFDPSQKEAYQSIRASQGLKNRVLQSKPKKVTRVFPLVGSGLVAAGIGIVFLSAIWSSTPATMSMGGQTVTETAVVLSETASSPKLARMGASIAQPISFDEEVTLLSADGILTDVQGQKQTLPRPLDAQETLFWEVQTPPETFSLTVEAKGKQQTFRMTYIPEENHWTVCRTKAE